MKDSIKVLMTLGVLSAIAIGGSAMALKTQRHISYALVAQTDQKGGYDESDRYEAKNTAEEMQEEAQYRSLAKISPQQAQQIAEAAQGQKAIRVALGAENGSLVYEVRFPNAEVKVDAGNGRILRTELAGQEENDLHEAPLDGSIQVPNSDRP
ncbi:PepSY domain-containing protein [Thermosynechococcus sp. QKsg1]|uniref:PepSY domain-containing protein n=1 Tax=unclassified Thermosynechococcus TaxID=2622553 RepID=UPI001D050D9B|nr:MULTISPECIES: PepSY domain-containing protein [unclassified Thermosynechococcus]WJI24000.1 PepSY domain-containing protein [Thermosynechococcus sp. B0]WJI26514.1 PepSY domain-containing protein [Thermosynechococcus sp. B1]WJI29040.1 PepSY domain-containing protein [Thermosynechococcus sp. B3]WNC86633.1 PepSY domain-containing protein [Thermosynechococcus sp. QKsg1]